jgi:hypothetical protein
MDTDSAYMALSGEFLDLIKPELRDEFKKEMHKWFPRTDTPEHIQYDKRKPGLFKIEYEGEGMVALCSKTYYCWGDSTKSKISCKGTQKDRNKELLNQSSYKNCLSDKTAVTVTNKGIRYVKESPQHSMVTYEQNKIGISSIYSKGVVMSDGIHIHPLQI